MRTILLVVTMLLGIMVTTSPLAAAQGNLDIEGTARRVLNADPELLLKALETPIDRQHLPDAFPHAEIWDPEGSGETLLIVTSDEVEHVVGAVYYEMSYAQTGFFDSRKSDATSTPDAKPRSGNSAYGYGTLSYIVLEDERAAEGIEDLRRSLEEDRASQSARRATSRQEFSIEDMTIDGTDALRITVLMKEGNIQGTTTMVAVPVGNVMVVSAALFAATDVDHEAVQADAEALLIAGVEHLGAVVETMP